MTIEIISASIISRHAIQITAINCSEENFERMERLRDDSYEQEIQYYFDSISNPKAFYVLRKWLQKQKTTAKAETWGEALQAVVGTITDSYGIGKFRVME